MRQVLIDEGVPHPLRDWIAGAEVFSVQWMGWAGIKNCELIKRINDHLFDVVITSDQQWSYQQNRNKWRFGVIELSTHSLPVLMQAAKNDNFIARLNDAVRSVAVGAIIELVVEKVNEGDDK